MAVLRFVLLVMLLCGFTGCIKYHPPVKESLVRVSWSNFDMFFDDFDPVSLKDAVDKSISYYNKLPGNFEFSLGKDVYSAEHLKRSLEVFKDFIELSFNDDAFWNRLKEHFVLYQSTGGADSKEVLFTGYYEPVLYGDFKRSEKFKYPIYRVPDNLLTINLSRFGVNNDKILIGRVDGKEVVPYYNRKEIDYDYAIRGEELLWLSDPVDKFFLEIQGSGRLITPDGKEIQISYNGKNGRPYRSIGGLLIREEIIPREEMTMQAIKSYLKANPHEMERIFNYNESYVFFKINKTIGAVGNIGLILTPERSLATDSRIFPKGCLSFISTDKPVFINGEFSGTEKISRFMLNQDTGGAIRGPGRADIFWGVGHDAGLSAGAMKWPGKLYFIVLNNRLLN